MLLDSYRPVYDDSFRPGGGFDVRMGREPPQSERDGPERRSGYVRRWEYLNSTHWIQPSSSRRSFTNANMYGISSNGVPRICRGCGHAFRSGGKLFNHLATGCNPISSGIGSSWRLPFPNPAYHPFESSQNEPTFRIRGAAKRLEGIVMKRLKRPLLETNTEQAISGNHAKRRRVQSLEPTPLAVRNDEYPEGSTRNTPPYSISPSGALPLLEDACVVVRTDVLGESSLSHNEHPARASMISNTEAQRFVADVGMEHASSEIL
ncbi:hypothetical protein EV356DRAFT_528996 [Viridothelium virens]|uniref:C2H2-type domain-containing protein n=1 Tax=Viridothelium virens TaxID=1048519 RepID=A0A6A6HM81_VIRVR|nr:hypothetical protein EV356DRAFT_528996 [Viridothelium virens]